MSIVTVSTAVDLKDFGLPESSFSLKSTCMDSDRFVAVQAGTGDGRQLSIIDMFNSNAVNKLPLKADAGAMDVSDNILALRATVDGSGTVIQVFDLDGKSRLGQTNLSESVLLLKWVAPRLLALVTRKAVYHWNLQGEPNLIFNLDGQLADESTRIINYSIDGPEAAWCMLTGLFMHEGVPEGCTQLHCSGKGHQLLTSPAACFGEMQVSESGNARALVALIKRDLGASASQVVVMPKPGSDAGGCTWNRVMCNLQLEQSDDFVMSLVLCDKTGLLYVLTNKGFAYIYDTASLTLLSQQRVSSDPIVAVTRNSKKGGVIVINKKGLVLHVGIDEGRVVSYIQNSLSLPEVAKSLALRFGYSGAEEVFMTQFRAAFARGDYRSAANIAAKVRSGALRTPQVIQQFKQAPAQDGTPAITTYFSVMLEQGRLNAAESLELVQPALAHSRVELIEKWLKEDSLECTTELGELIKPVAPHCASAVFAKAGAHQKVVQAMAEAGKYDQIPAYVRQNGGKASVDFAGILRTLAQLDRDQLLSFAKQLLDPELPALCDPQVVFQTMCSSGRQTEACAVLLEHLRPNKPDQGHLQTLLLLTAIKTNTQLAEAVFQMNIFTHYDRTQIAQACEAAGMTQRALEHHTDMAAIRRCMLNNSAGMGGITIEWLTNFFQHLPGENIVEVLGDLLRASRTNSKLVLDAALKFHEKAGAANLAAMMEAQGCQDAAFALLNSIVSTTTDPEVVFKFVESAARLNLVGDVDRVLRENPNYDAVKVKDFLKEAKLSDARPLIYVCNENGFIEELTEYLFKFQLMNYLEIYVLRVNPKEAPRILGCLIDLDCGEDFLEKLLSQLRGCDSAALIDAFQARSRLRLLSGWLDQRVSEGSQEAAVHNALAIIAIDCNRDAEQFLKTNTFYDPKVVGLYCEERDPHLACVAYRRHWGQCDEEFVRVSNNNGLFRALARYCVERQNAQLWSLVLSEDNAHRGQFVEHVISYALPESSNADEVAVAVKAFMAADMPHHLIELLEKIVLHNPEFQGIANLQTLLITTAIRTAPARVLEYVSRLEDYDGLEIAKLCLNEKYNLAEEAIVIYTKQKMHAEVVQVLLDNLQSFDRAHEYAHRINAPELWHLVGKAELNRNNLHEAIDCFIKANDGSDYKEVIQRAEETEQFEVLVKYLEMARVTVKESKIDSSLVYAMARCEQLTEEFFSVGSTLANLQMVGDRLYDEKHFDAARLVYAAIPNNARLASTLVMLGRFEDALDAAKKAKNPRVWKELCIACVSANRFDLAQLAGSHVIMQPDHLEDLVRTYEAAGNIDALIDLLKSGLTSDNAHPVLFTELGIQFVKHRQSELKAFAHQYAKRINLPKLIRECESHGLWSEAVDLYILYGEADQAVQTMMSRPECWNADVFQEALKKVSNTEVFYRVATHYLQSHPNLLAATLMSVVDRLDHARVVNVLRRSGGAPALLKISDYLTFVQQKKEQNIREVNEALNEQYIEKKDFASLRESVTSRDNFDQLALAGKLEKHDSADARSIAVALYRLNNKFKQAMHLAQNDKCYKDVLQVAKASGKADLVEELLRFFADQDEKEAFAAALFVCYELIKPDVVMEIEWRKNWTDAAKPYWIQHTHENQKRLEAIEKKLFGTTQAAANEPAGKKGIATGPSDLDSNTAASMLAGFGTSLTSNLVNGQLALTSGAGGAADPFKM